MKKYGLYKNKNIFEKIKKCVVQNCILDFFNIRELIKLKGINRYFKNILEEREKFRIFVEFLKLKQRRKIETLCHFWENEWKEFEYHIKKSTLEESEVNLLKTGILSLLEIDVNSHVIVDNIPLDFFLSYKDAFKTNRVFKELSTPYGFIIKEPKKWAEIIELNITQKFIFELPSSNDAESLGIIISAINRSNSVKELEFRFLHHLGPNYHQVFYENLNKNQKIKKIKFVDYRLLQKNSYLYDLFKNITSLEEISLNCYNLGDDGVTYLSEALKQNYSLSHINLTTCNIGNKGVNALSKVIVNMKNLETLKLSKNNIGGPGIVKLCGALNLISDLKKLSLNGNDFGSDGIVALHHAIKNQKNLMHLNLNHNLIGNSGVMMILDSLRDNQVIKTLKLSNNSLKKKGFLAIADLIKRIKSLEVLDISRNMFELQECKIICKSISGNEKFKELIVSKRYISNEAFTYLEKNFNERPNLSKKLIDFY